MIGNRCEPAAELGGGVQQPDEIADRTEVAAGTLEQPAAPLVVVVQVGGVLPAAAHPLHRLHETQQTGAQFAVSLQIGEHTEPSTDRADIVEPSPEQRTDVDPAAPSK
ncbi:hypothetical protein FHX74_000508 [Friedmanniella endophytica]|uniref:Uncharacterized protein n=1 Tax=Microlunatus kandeliicorticis TaxID=1759536 RepID=A0A7W3P4H9_9ACTN|nr:hypothetical protein [Microlunatus kandeliicorticis]